MTTGFANEEWEELVLYIQNRQVIPVVGPELVTVESAGTRMPLTRWLAPRLAEQLKLKGDKPNGYVAFGTFVGI
jgi:hypothetical protein